MGKILLIIDPQYDFINGSLAVPNAIIAMEKLTEFLKSDKTSTYDKVIITADYHPINHCSFATWPIHCVQNTIGGAIFDPIVNTLFDKRNAVPFEILTKGDNADKEEYSIMQNAVSSAILMQSIKNKDIDICGIAGDYCVKETIEDLVKLGYGNKITVLTDFVASIDGGEALKQLIQKEKLQTK